MWQMEENDQQMFVVNDLKVLSTSGSIFKYMK